MTEPPLLQGLEGLADHELDELIVRARAVIEARAKERRRSALEEIRRIARDNGLAVSVKEPARRRGRPPKVGGAA